MDLEELLLSSFSSESPSADEGVIDSSLTV